MAGQGCKPRLLDHGRALETSTTTTERMNIMTTGKLNYAGRFVFQSGLLILRVFMAALSILFLILESIANDSDKNKYDQDDNQYGNNSRKLTDLYFGPGTFDSKGPKF
jgi:hypothetical protein